LTVTFCARQSVQPAYLDNETKDVQWEVHVRLQLHYYNDRMSTLFLFTCFFGCSTCCLEFNGF